MQPMPPAAVARPIGATVISVIAGVEGVLLALAGVLTLVGAGMLGAAAGAGEVPGLGAAFAGIGAVIAIIFLLIAGLYLAMAYGVWKARAWSWMLGAVVSVIALVFAVLGLGSNGVNVSSIVSVALPAVILYFLMQADVKRYLGRAA